MGHTVDGGNPAPVEVGSLSHYLQGFSTIPGGDRQISAINSISRFPELSTQILRKNPGVTEVVIALEKLLATHGVKSRRVTLLAIEKDGAIYETRGVFYSALYTDEYDVIINMM